MDENKNIELNVERLGGVAGGGGKPKQDFGKRAVNCPSCGAKTSFPCSSAPA